MWFFPTKKQVKKEFKKISNSFRNRDKKISNVQETTEKIKDDLDSNSQKIARLEGVVSVLLSQKSQVVSGSIRRSQGNIENKIINKVRRSKKALIMAEISKLAPSLSVIEIFGVIVKEKGLCSKASFYRYVSSIRSQKLIENETELRLK